MIDPAANITFSGADNLNHDMAIEAASRWIDEKTGTRFYSSTETRYYTPDYYDLLYIDDLISVTTLKTDDNWDNTYETTWTASTDYYLEPRNAQANSNDLRPYRQIRINPNGSYTFPVGVTDGVELVGAFGYAATAPTNIKQACIMLGHRLWKRKDTVFGIAGTPAVGGVTIIQAKITADADIMALLQAVDKAYVP